MEIAGAREKLEKAERQVAEGRFGAAIFYAYRARRVAESVLDEAKQVMRSGKGRLIRAKRVNLRAGPSTDQRVLSVLVAGVPVVPQITEGEWTLVQVPGGPAGWIHRSLLGNRITESTELSAAPTPKIDAGPDHRTSPVRVFVRRHAQTQSKTSALGDWPGSGATHHCWVTKPRPPDPRPSETN